MNGSQKQIEFAEGILRSFNSEVSLMISDLEEKNSKRPLPAKLLKTLSIAKYINSADFSGSNAGSVIQKQYSFEKVSNFKATECSAASIMTSVLGFSVSEMTDKLNSL